LYFYPNFSMKLYLFTQQRSCRLTYILSEFLRYSSFDGYEIIYELSDLPDQAICINYSEITIRSKNIQIVPSGLLEENVKSEIPAAIRFRDGLPWFFKTGNNGDIWDYDVFSMMFYLLSRMEEYGEVKRDELGRIIGSFSFSAKNGFIKVPVVDLWKKVYWESLSNYWRIPLKNDFPTGLNWTIDVDLAWAFRHKSYGKMVLSLIKEWASGQRDAARLRGAFLIRGTDPFDTYDLLETCASMPGINMTLFFLLGDRTELDQNHRHDHPALVQLIQTLQEKYTCGLHPSSKAFTAQNQLITEIKRWEKISGRHVALSRQHYLLLQLPDTYRNLIIAGVKEDHTMGYHDSPGYRAATACPFAWYDLENEVKTELMVHPFYAMDGTYKKHNRLTPDEALKDIIYQIDMLAREGLPLTLIWHNSSMSPLMGWKDWATLPNEICTYASKKYT
jgi:hypothetical protein